MRKELALILPVIAVLSVLAVNAVAAQNMSTPVTNMTAGMNMINVTMGGNMTCK
jgi:hypothetical protein